MDQARLTRRSAITGAVLASAALATGAAWSQRVRAQAATPVAGGTLGLAASQEPDTLYPPNTVLSASYSIISMVYDRLVWIGLTDGQPRPWIAEAWEISDDGRTLTFTLREGVTFTDGTPLDAAAVKFNLDAWLSSEATGTVDLGSLESVDAPDATTVILNFAEPYAPIFTSLSALGLFSPTAYQADPDGFGRAPVGSGPFILTEWVAATSMHLERNPAYVNTVPDDANRGPAYVDAIDVFFLPETATQVAAFESGELDVLSITREEYERYATDPAYKVLTTEDTTVLLFLQYQATEPFLQEPLRKAISYAVNPQQIVELAYLNGAKVNQCPLPTGVSGYNPELCAEHGYTYDPDRARQILADAGWEDGDGDGFVEIDGSADPLVLYTYGPLPSETRSIELIQADLAAVGIRVELQVLEIASLLAAINDGTANFIYVGWGYPDPAIMSRILKSPGWAGAIVGSPELDELLVATDTAVDPAARQEALDAAMTYILDQAIVTPIATPYLDYAAHANVNGFKLDFANVPHYTDVWLAPE